MRSLEPGNWIPEVLYRSIVKSMPVSCVDLIVQDKSGQILMVKRRNDPARGCWWLPGGRVHYGELRQDAAVRKLHQECALRALEVRELFTLDLIYAESLGKEFAAHGISTVYLAKVTSGKPALDSQSSDFAWKSADSWLAFTQDPMLAAILQRFIRESSIAQ